MQADDRIAWTLRYVEGHDLKATAALCDCSFATVKRRIRRAQRYIESHFVKTGGASLGELSREQPTLAVFLRHAGCTFCRMTLHDLTEQRGRIEQAGVRLAIVHMSRPLEATIEFERHGLEDLQASVDLAPITANQVVYNLFDRRNEAGIRFARENGVGVMTHGSLSSGLLAGAFTPDTVFAEKKSPTMAPRSCWRTELTSASILWRYSVHRLAARTSKSRKSTRATRSNSYEN